MAYEFSLGFDHGAVFFASSFSFWESVPRSGRTSDQSPPDDDNPGSVWAGEGEKANNDLLKI